MTFKKKKEKKRGGQRKNKKKKKKKKKKWGKNNSREVAKWNTKILCVWEKASLVLNGLEWGRGY